VIDSGEFSRNRSCLHQLLEIDRANLLIPKNNHQKFDLLNARLTPATAQLPIAHSLR